MTLPDRSGLVVPVVLWGRKPPQSRASQVTCMQNGRIIITGTREGQVIQWSVDDALGWIQPQMMMLAHECAITCISPTSSASTATKYVTCSEDGHICLWDSVDGRVVESVRTNYVHRRITPHCPTSSDPRSPSFLLCIGDYADIIVMDAQDLNILLNLSSRVEPDWIATMTLVHPHNRHDVVIGVSVSSMIKLWSLTDLDKKDSGNVVYEDESKVMTARNVRAISCSNLNTRIMLVICGSSWQIVDPSNLNQLIVSECAIEAVQGMIIDIDRVAIGFADSTIVLFQLPRSKLCGKQVRDKFGEHPPNIGNIDQPFVFALLKGIASSPSAPIHTTIQFHFDQRQCPDGKIRRTAYRVDQQGYLSLWHIPKNYDLLVNEFIRSRRPVVYEPTLKQSFTDVWNRLSPPPANLPGTDEDQPIITATIYISHQGKLFFGRDDGSIMMMSACHAVSCQLLEMSPSDSVVPHRLLAGGHTSSVNCFLYPFDESDRYDPHSLLSGGEDFSILVWNIVTGSKVHRFCCQGGPILRMLVPPSNCNPRVLQTICAIAGDNSAALLSLKENKCILLASRQQFPIVDVRWRPLDDFLLLRCEDDSVYIWQIETSNLDRIVTGLITEDIMEASKEQVGLMDVEDEAGASQAIQMLRALRNKNVSAIKKVAAHTDDKAGGGSAMYSNPSGLPSPLDVVQLKECSDQAHLILFNVDSLIADLLSMDYELSSLPMHSAEASLIENKLSMSNLIAKKHEQNLQQNHLPLQPSSPAHSPGAPLSPPPIANSLDPLGDANKSTNTSTSSTTLAPTRWQSETNLYMETARLLISLLHAWNLDENLDSLAQKVLKLSKPKIPICYGIISRKGHISLHMPFCTGKSAALNDRSYSNFSKTVRWQESRALNTVHLLSAIAMSNTLMSLRSRHLHLSHGKRPTLSRRVSSNKSNHDSSAESESQHIKQAWSNVAALHCVLLPDLVKPSTSYGAPRIDLLARRWQDSCIEIRDAAQALLIRELNRLGAEGRRRLMDTWAVFLPTLLDPSLSIFGAKLNSSTPSSYANSQLQQLQQQPLYTTSTATNSSPSPSIAASGSSLNTNSTALTTSKPPVPPPPLSPRSTPSIPPVPPRQPSSGAQLPPPAQLVDATSNASSTANSTSNENSHPGNHVGSSTAFTTSETMLLEGEHEKCGGIHQVRRNQATAIVVLGVMGAEFASELQANADLARATAHSLLELLLAGESPLLPQNSPLRRAAIDLLGRGFVVWQPHLDISRVLLSLLDLAAAGDKYLPMGVECFGAPLTAEADACRTARHALSLIASARPQALITALSMEVARYNAAAQHQTIQHTVTSPLLKSRMEILRLIEQLADKQYGCVADLVIPVGDILVHCLDTSLLKQRTLAEIFPPIAKFYMVAYCPSTRRIAIGGKNGSIVVHELRASKALTVHSHESPITALAFSQDGKYLAAYASQDAKISFWQTQQTFLGMGQSQIRCVKTLPAPSEFPVISPGGSYQNFRARLVWINAKSLTLMLPNGKEHRFTV